MGGGLRDPWWRQTLDRKQLSAKLEDILAAARARRREYGRQGKREQVGEVVSFDSGSEGSWYDETDTGDAWVSKEPCVGTRWSARGIGRGHEQVASPGGHRGAVRHSGGGLRSIAM